MLDPQQRRGATWSPVTVSSAYAVREPQATICAGHAVDDLPVRRGPPSDADGSWSPVAVDLGSGTPGRGLSIATSSSRVYVAWFDGNRLKLRRFSIGSSSSHHLTSLGTSTLATLHSGIGPQIGADGDAVILAYLDMASLKVRRSTDKGASFGSARTLRLEGYPGEIGAFPHSSGRVVIRPDAKVGSTYGTPRYGSSIEQPSPSRSASGVSS